MPTDNEVVRGWLAYRELHQNGLIRLNPYKTTHAVMAQHSEGSLFKPESLGSFIAKDPHNLQLIYETGLDFMRHGTAQCVVLERLPRYLAETRGLAPPGDEEGLDQLFSEEAQCSALQLLEATRKRRASDQQAVARDVASSRDHYSIRPFVLADLSGFLFTRYLITEDEVRIQRSVFGIKFGERPIVRVSQITRIHATGTFWGTLTFGEGSAEPVIWTNVYRPEKKLRAVKQLIARLAASQTSIDSAAAGE